MTTERKAREIHRLYFDPDNPTDYDDYPEFPKYEVPKHTHVIYREVLPGQVTLSRDQLESIIKDVFVHGRSIETLNDICVSIFGKETV